MLTLRAEHNTEKKHGIGSLVLQAAVFHAVFRFCIPGFYTISFTS